MTGAFADWLASRSTERVELAPGIATPRTFGDARREHLATRRAGGLFDFSFMGCTAVGGPDALGCVNAMQTRRLGSLRPGRIAYTLLLREDGTVLNDATVWCVERDLYWLFTGRRADRAHIAGFSRQFDVEIADRSPSHAVISIQGDISRCTVERCLPGTTLAALPYFGLQRASFGVAECWIARLGYSGETGYELVVASEAAPALWKALLAQGAEDGLTECGLDAIDSLRIEAGHILFTKELASPVTPLELGLARFVDFESEASYGMRALREERWREPRRRLAGLLPAHGDEAETGLPERLDDGSAAITSTCWSPLLERRIAIGFVTAPDAHPGATVRLRSGARARVARLPFYDPAKVLPRRVH